MVDVVYVVEDVDVVYVVEVVMRAGSAVIYIYICFPYWFSLVCLCVSTLLLRWYFYYFCSINNGHMKNIFGTNSSLFFTLWTMPI